MYSASKLHHYKRARQNYELLAGQVVAVRARWPARAFDSVNRRLERHRNSIAAPNGARCARSIPRSSSTAVVRSDAWDLFISRK